MVIKRGWTNDRCHGYAVYTRDGAVFIIAGETARYRDASVAARVSDGANTSAWLASMAYNAIAARGPMGGSLGARSQSIHAAE